MIERKLHRVIKDRFFKGKAIVLIGARQVGKTTLLQELTNGTNDVLWLNGDELATKTFAAGEGFMLYMPTTGGSLKYKAVAL